MTDMTSRPYAADDYAACLAIFDSNVPKFLAPEERVEFQEFLGAVNADDNLYSVLIRDSAIVACGGLYIERTKRQASLSWGMVDRRLHRQKLGSALTEARLALARSRPEVDVVTLATSQHTYPFYERFGFSVTKVTPDGFAKGLDCWDMSLRIGG
ncbi:MAG: GNAT family N-acetyltransferase [Pikeienuella sp.]